MKKWREHWFPNGLGIRGLIAILVVTAVLALIPVSLIYGKTEHTAMLITAAIAWGSTIIKDFFRARNGAAPKPPVE